MPGRKICVVTANVNQHTDHGLLTFPLATDFALLLRDRFVVRERCASAERKQENK
jgi:hypothetical protein